jgi:hypothetical protein
MMKVHIVEIIASGAPYVAPILLARLDALREKPDDAHSLGMLGASVKIAIRAGEHVGDPPDGARITMQALDDSAVFPVFEGTIRVEPLDAFSCRLILAGCYSVPLGAIGEVVDRTIFAGAAKGSLRALLGAVQSEIASSVLRSIAAT